jgi:putative colanic acid biosynthesis glycosyltransferase WcaI
VDLRRDGSHRIGKAEKHRVRGLGFVAKDGQKYRKTILVFTQPFIPDPASVGQHMADAATELARRGHRVVVITSDRGYDDPTVRYKRGETINGVEIRRVPLTSFGKSRGSLRAFGAAIFMTRCLAAGLFTRNVDGILFNTSPPFLGAVAAVISGVRQCPIAYWAMDMNPDQLIALGKIRAHGVMARVLGAVDNFILRRSTLIVALDRFMKERLTARADVAHKTIVIAPWPHDDALARVPRAPNPFRAKYGLDGRIVVMYSGNHSSSNPLTTLLDAAVQFKDDRRVQFVFVGGGTGKKEVEEYRQKHSLDNVVSLPYQPMTELRYSLGAADVHVVSLGEGMTGIIHPCKVYGAMSVGRPILYFGPQRSHIADLLQDHDIGWVISHGDITRTTDVIRTICTLPESVLERMGSTANQIVRELLSQTQLCDEFCNAVERAFWRQTTKSPRH